MFLDRLHIDKTWSLWFVFCEFLNAVNIVLQVYLTNWFLSGNFYSLGPKVLEDGLDGEVYVLDYVFPKVKTNVKYLISDKCCLLYWLFQVTKCSFHKYGPSGTIQSYDAMCVMALNIINEKIYTFLWFWYVVLGVVTLLGLLWRLLTIYMHSRSHSFNRIVFSNNCPGKLNPWQVLHVTREFHFADWLFLYYLSKNMDGYVFMKLFLGLAESMDNMGKPTEPLIIIDSEDKEKVV